jgi:AraC-like DNA-binding protein/mannose-6-phosphate isomerase-like protein (cupin superfamily)
MTFSIKVVLLGKRLKGGAGMKEFLYWGQVQARLSEHFDHTGEAYSFFDAVKELWEEGNTCCAEEYPRVSFQEWNVMDAEQFDCIYRNVPVDMGKFLTGFQRNQNAAQASEAAHAVSVYLMRIASDQAMGVHHHEYFEIDYIMKGSAGLESAGGRSTLREGDFCLISSGMRHDVIPERGSQVISITIPGAALEQTLFRLLRKDNILTSFFHSALDSNKTGYLVISVPGERRIKELIRGLLHEFFTSEEYAEEIMPDHLAILFAFILRRCGEHYEYYRGDSGQPSILAVLKYIQNHYKDTSLGQVAQEFHYEPSYLGKLIKNTTNLNYTDIVRNLRIEESRRLLRATSLTMDEVAEQVGYMSRVHFFRSFRKAVGMTPGDYRKKRQQSE